MTKTINVPYPLNVSDQDKLMYEPYLSYELASPTIKKKKNVFITFSGFA
ncbi:MAG: glycosyltransferase family 61 protein [Mucilaginibacter sp.]|nr:glycosyltransferase family 61 protein [Mucilaginibacter sp.]